MPGMGNEIWTWTRDNLQHFLAGRLSAGWKTRAGAQRWGRGETGGCLLPAGAGGPSLHETNQQAGMARGWRQLTGLWITALWGSWITIAELCVHSSDSWPRTVWRKMHSICGQCHGGGSWCCSPGTLGMLLRQLWSAALGWFFTASKWAFLRIHCRFPYPCQCLLWGCVVHKQASKAEAKMDTSLLQIQVFFSALGYWSVKLSPAASDFFFQFRSQKLYSNMWDLGYTMSKYMSL